MTRYFLALLAVLSLSGCLEDKEAILAECRLKYEKQPADDFDASEKVMLCMRTKGYEFETSYDENHTVNVRCWGGYTGTFTVPTTPFYAMASCYKEPSFINSLR